MEPIDRLYTMLDARTRALMTMAFTIDVHHHILPDAFWRATNDAHSPVGGITSTAANPVLPRPFVAARGLRPVYEIFVPLRQRRILTAKAT